MKGKPVGPLDKSKPAISQKKTKSCLGCLRKVSPQVE